MNYSHICRYVSETPWSILPTKLAELLSVLAFRAAGGEFTRDEIEARIGNQAGASSASARGAVAVVPVRGVIAHRMGSMDDTSGGTSTERIAAMLRHVASDGNIGTIVLDIDSPGGTVPGLSELATEIRALRGTKRIIAVANSLAASAAYWIASQADEVVSIPSGMVGSIGVINAHQDLSQALEQQGITVTLISAGKYKTENNPFEPLTDEGKAVLQKRVDEAYAAFVRDVALGRNVSMADVRKGYGQGRVLSATDALEAGLIDRIATLDEVLSGAVGKRSAPAGARAELASLGIDLDEDLSLDAQLAETERAAVESERRRRLERF